MCPDRALLSANAHFGDLISRGCDTPGLDRSNYEINGIPLLAMAWMWWLLAPVLTTASGALVVWWRGRLAIGRAGPGQAMAQHQRLIRALAQGHAAAEEPVNIVVEVAPADGAG
jgi:hypothetical protein